MMSKGYKSVTRQDVLNRVSELQILAHYFGIYRIPTLINSPLREDKNASFGFYSPDGISVNYKDFGCSSEHGSIFTLLHRIWGIDYNEVYYKILHDTAPSTICNIKSCRVTSNHGRNGSSLEVKVREWRNYDLDWWGQYGITRKWLDLAEVYPISHIIRIKDNKSSVFAADKLAYVYIERKEGKITKKIYQPLNTNGYKWCQDNDKSVLGLWRILPPTGDMMFICSSVKDSLTLIANCGIPAICMQGEGYTISNTVISQLKRRFKKVYICLDNDPPGTLDAKKLSDLTGFTNIVLPQFVGGKDIADYRKIYGHNSFVQMINSLIK